MFRWDDLKIFLEVSKTLNLSKAARALDIDQTTVYRRIMRLEKKLGKILFKKSRQGYTLTSWGEGLLRKSAHFADEMSKINRFLENGHSDVFGYVNITTTNVIANVVLPPYLTEFLKLYPNLQLDITVCEDFFDMYKREADLAIRSSDAVEPHVYSRKIGKGTWALYATEYYLKNRPGFNSSNFFSENRFIVGSERLANLKSTKWLKSKIQEENIALKANSMESIYSAVKAGMGIGLLPCVYKASDNSIIEISEPDHNFGSPIWLITHKESINIEKIKICMDFFEKNLKRVFRY